MCFIVNQQPEYDGGGGELPRAAVAGSTGGHGDWRTIMGVGALWPVGSLAKSPLDPTV